MAQTPQPSDGSEITVFYAIAVVILVLWLIYFLLKPEILTVLFYLKFYELKVIAYFIPKYKLLSNWLVSTSLNNVDLGDVYYLCKEVGKVLRYPFIAISIILAFLLYRFHPQSYYQNIYNMKTLAKFTGDYNPMASYVINKNLCKLDLTEGSWSMGITPLEFAKKHDLLDHQGNLNKDKSYHVFLSQLGKKWSGLKKLNFCYCTVIAACSAYIAGDRVQAENFVKDIAIKLKSGMALSKSQKNNVIQSIKTFINRYYKHDKVQETIKQHAYVNTVVAALLIEARKNGIVPPALFIWIKPLDRTLWYIINNIGRKSVFIEAAAPIMHLNNEKRVGVSIHYPTIDNLIGELEDIVA
ncbi:type IVB secretion system coupling complex protein DotM/IcmP [Facilibium subflavum]|uniref:type IVB secretion system coupling complex protein DotM/IcmP n=1 Tax=Facilibium subflavum TaxID=2219058 RepID=UPI000E64CCCF|nr:type IVB secretion system coupling complex protein DotM/IcmP [Facilibium subflavum]